MKFLIIKDNLLNKIILIIEKNMRTDKRSSSRRSKGDIEMGKIGSPTRV